ncbi:MAG TPA: RsmE family RNA methyltransferase, partial [Oscillatoriaceae cyanobacterium]
AGLTLPRALPTAPPERLNLYVGPEGGWAGDELDWLQAHGAVEVSLGRRILRTETAGLAALAIVMATYELA